MAVVLVPSRLPALLARLGLAATVLALVVAEVWRSRRRLTALREECSKLHELRMAERSGRTAAERRLRQVEVANSAASSGTMARRCIAFDLTICYINTSRMYG